jgi:DNA-binding MarR family transcriptional regulator
MGATRKSQHHPAEEIVGRLVPRHSTAAVLFHHAIAERLGLGPTDHKCLDLLRERGAMTGSELAEITGLTTGAITGVVERLGRTGYLRRKPDLHDGRKQILQPVLERGREIGVVFEPIKKDLAALLEDFDSRELAAISEFLTRTTNLVYRHVALLRSDTLRREPEAPGYASNYPPTASVRIQRRSKNRKLRVKR